MTAIGTYRSIWLWARGRDADVEPGAIVFRSTEGTLALPIAFGVATLIEVVALHFLIPWQWLRIALAVLSVWSLVAVFGYLARHRVHPHCLTSSSLVLRQSGQVVATIPRSDIASVAPVRRFAETSARIAGSTLHLPNLDGTNIDVRLTQTVAARIPTVFGRADPASIDRICLYVDDPGAMERELKKTHPLRL